MLPYQFVKSDGGDKTLYLPFVYLYGTKSKIKVEDGDEFLSGILEKLHALDLTKTLYPSKGRYQWSKLSLECGKTYWAPLDNAEFGELGTSFTEFSLSVEDDFLQEHAQRTDYLSLMFNYPSLGDERYDYPETTFLELASKFNFEEEREFSSTLQDSSFNRELYSSLDFLNS